MKRFCWEAEAAAQLNNPHIIPIDNYGEIDGRLYVDMLSNPRPRPTKEAQPPDWPPEPGLP